MRGVPRALVGGSLHACYALGILLSRSIRTERPYDAEVHTLLCHEHLLLYLFAAKSLLRYSGRLRAVVHDDGSLSTVDRWILRFHLPNCRIISKEAADREMEARLERYPQVRRVRAENVRLCQLVDYCALSSTDRVIGMDSDVLFLREPKALLDWVSGQRGDSVLYSPERAPKGSHWVPEVMGDVGCLNDLCCGLVCQDRRTFFDLPLLERLIEMTPDRILEGKRWVVQMYYSLLGAACSGQKGSLGGAYESGRVGKLPECEGRVFYHYFASLRRTTARENLVAERKMFYDAWPNVATRVGIGVYDAVVSLRTAFRRQITLSRAPRDG